MTPWTAAYQALPSMGFSRQEYWSGVPLPSYHKKKKKKSPHTSAGEGVERREPSYTVGRKVNWYSQYGEQYGDSLKSLNIEIHMILPSKSGVYIQRKI